MQIKILNEEHGIGSCDIEDIPEWVTKLGSAKDVVFFYCQDRDFVVLNEDNVNYESYKMLIEVYLSADDYQRKEAMKASLLVDIKGVYIALRKLNWIIRVRRNLYKSMIRKAGKDHETN